MVGFCKEGFEFLGYVKKGKILDWLIEYLVCALTDLFS